MRMGRTGNSTSMKSWSSVSVKRNRHELGSSCGCLLHPGSICTTNSISMFSSLRNIPGYEEFLPILAHVRMTFLLWLFGVNRHAGMPLLRDALGLLRVFRLFTPEVFALVFHGSLSFKLCPEAPNRSYYWCILDRWNCSSCCQSVFRCFM